MGVKSIGLASIAVAMLGSGPADAADKRTYKVTVQGSKYRVSVNADGEVTVVNKALITGRTMDGREKMRVAVRQATGCALIDELWFDATLKGKLDCTMAGSPSG